MNKKQELNSQSESQEDETIPTVGLQLRLARENAGLTVDTVAKQLFLSKNIIDEIEADNIPSSVHSLYSKGYVKSYSTLLNLSVDDILENFEKQYECDSDLKEMQTFSNRSQTTIYNNYLNWITTLVIIIMIIGVGVWWWKQQTMVTVPVVDPIAINNIPSQLLEDNSGININIEEEPSILVDYTFTFSKDCWVKITDATNAVVAIGIQKADSTVLISGVAPLEVVLGASHAVTIIHQQEVVDISPYTSKNTATFSLPLEQ